MTAITVSPSTTAFAQQALQNQHVLKLYSELSLTNTLTSIPNALITISPSIETHTVVSKIDDIHEPLRTDVEKVLSLFSQSLDQASSELVALDLTDHFRDIDWKNITSVVEGFKPVLGYLKPVVDFVKKHPWVLIPLLIPAIEIMLIWVGFAEAGVVAGSIAAALQSRIGDVPKGSIFSFLQSHGAGGFAAKAFKMGAMFVTIAVILAAIYYILVDTGVVDDGKATQAIEAGWNKAVSMSQRHTLEIQPVAGGGNQLQIYVPKQGVGSVSRGVWTVGWVLIVGFILNGVIVQG